jgi:hypothetical protein
MARPLANHLPSQASVNPPESLVAATAGRATSDAIAQHGCGAAASRFHRLDAASLFRLALEKAP